MRHVTRSSALVLACALACLLASPAIEAGSLLGRWKLVQQTYGEGKSNLVREDDPPPSIEFQRRGSEIVARLRAGTAGDIAVDWPRLVVDTDRSTLVQELRYSVAEDRVLARYRVEPSAGDDLVLRVVEEYRVVEEGTALVGTVVVRFEREGKDHGSYRLHRRYERQP